MNGHRTIEDVSVIGNDGDVRPLRRWVYCLAIGCLLGSLSCGNGSETNQGPGTPSVPSDANMSCLPNCESKRCGGDNGCGSECPNVCDGTCDETGKCTGTLTCTSSCDGKVCGDDGCGTHCGLCTAGLVCSNEGTCDLPEDAGGDTCINPIEVDSFPYSVVGNTAGYGSNYGYSANSCPGVSGSRGTASADTVYAFTPEISGPYTFELEAMYDANLYIVNDCTDITGSCLGANDAIGSEQLESLDVTLSANVTYYVIVDGWSNYSDVHGWYTLQINEGCVPNCTDKICGSDGCGGMCPNQCGNLPCDVQTETCMQPATCPPACAESEVCMDGFCCVPNCDGKECGSDGCGGECPDLCDAECNEELGVCDILTGEGACMGFSDQGILKNSNAIMTAWSCAEDKTSAQYGTVACLVEEMGVTQACAGCFDGFIVCLAEMCADSCQNGHTDECEGCAIPMCGPGLNDCAGLPFIDGI